MSFPLLGFIAQVTLFAFPLCWLMRFLEKRIIGVKSDFWDAFLASFLSLIGTTVIGALMQITLWSLPWILYDLIYVLLAIVLWVFLLRKLLRFELGQSVKISIVMVIVIYTIGVLLSMIGI
ncbi:MAG: hypothetical protein KDA29_08870 [Phycisphaerales bacterium]|nr:hypothetical protein [Phycisphaerales bacterium]